MQTPAAARSAVVAQLRTRFPSAGLNCHRVRAVEGRLKGLTRVAANEGAHLEAALDLRLQVRRPVDRRAGQRSSTAGSSSEASAGRQGAGSLSGSVVATGC